MYNKKCIIPEEYRKVADVAAFAFASVAFVAVAESARRPNLHEPTWPSWAVVADAADHRIDVHQIDDHYHSIEY